MQYGFHFDSTRCTGCKTCTVACKDYHDQTQKFAYRKVYEISGGDWVEGEDGAWSNSVYTYLVSANCGHCDDPACTHVCPTGAMHKDGETGLVGVDATRCIGCGYCAMACPYGNPKVDRDKGHSVKCDGCIDRVREGKNPICADACPLRAIDFGPIDELRRRFGTLDELFPLPAASYTHPNLVITPPTQTTVAAASEPQIVNTKEVLF